MSDSEEKMKFYCLYDLIDYSREQKGESTKEMFEFFRRKKSKRVN